MNREDFERQLAAEGYENLVSVERQPLGALAEHAHPFEAKALILDGEITIGVGGVETTYRAGDVFHLPSGQPHLERFGPQGLRYLAGRK